MNNSVENIKIFETKSEAMKYAEKNIEPSFSHDYSTGGKMIQAMYRVCPGFVFDKSLYDIFEKVN